MLYDPKWEKKTEAPDVFSLDSLIAWLETKNPSISYRYGCNGHCLLAQYFTAMGFENVTMWVTCFWHGPECCPGNVGQDEAIRLRKATMLPPHFNEIACNDDTAFGAALSRARALSPTHAE